ncbi:MAG: ABC transporter permease [Actinopolymorphaceae bacterium]
MTRNDAPSTDRARAADPVATRRPVSRLRLWLVFVRQAFVRDTHYRLHFVTTVGVGFLQLGLALVPILLMYGYTDDIRGWSRTDVIALVGMYQIATGLMATFVAPNLHRMTTYITRGELDGILLRPVSAQFFLTFRWVDLAELGTVGTGTVVLVVALSSTEVLLGGGAILSAGVLLACGLVLLTCVWSALSYSAFWLQSVDPVPLVFQAVMEAGKYPLPFFPPLARGFLTFVFPVAFATTFPVQALHGDIAWPVVVGGCALAAGAVLVLRAYWRFGLRSYASASS